MFDSKKLGLFVSHHLYLTEAERYSLIDGNIIDTTGVSVPVWINDNYISSEPAKEIFCKYRVFNNTSLGDKNIELAEGGYYVYLPQLPLEVKQRPNDDIWSKLPTTQREFWFEQNAKISALNLRNPPNAAAYLRFECRETNNVLANHYVTIQDVKELNMTFF